MNFRSMIGALAALISIGAGLNLLMSGSASEELTVFDSLFRGIGAYLIARGLWMVATSGRYVAGSS